MKIVQQINLINLFISFLTNLISKPEITKTLVFGLVNLNIYYTCKKIKSPYNNNRFKISAPTWNDEFDLFDGSYSISGIQDYFEFIVKNTKL